MAAMVALLAGAVAWFIGAPAVRHGSVQPPPEIDIDPPALRARRDAAIAAAKLPDDPWTFAQSLAPSSPDGPVAKERCGIEDGPRFSQPAVPDEAPVRIRAPSTRYSSAEARIDAALRSSADPLDRAVADLVNLGGMRSESGIDDAVVQQAATTTDARVYALAYGLCHSTRAPAASCASITAERWIQLDPGNGTPWLPLLARAADAGDAAALANAMSHLASSARFDIYFGAPAGAVARQAPDEGADLAAYADVTLKVAGMVAALPVPAQSRLIEACRNHSGGDEQRERQCRSISDGMFERSDALVTQSVGATLLFQATGDTSRRELVRAQGAALVAHWSPATGLSPCQDLRDRLKLQRRGAEIGEVGALRERMRQSVTP